METIRVNMTPCEDVQTIHASQNDNEAREWGFELHNNGEKIDSSSISDQMVFKAYEGGTEQILPENTSTPTTSPFKGDIKYPQGLLTDQEFTYRQSPTEEDGLTLIKSIKGNTLVWNQLVQNGNFESTSGWTLSDSVSASASNNVLTATIGTTHHSSIRLANSNIPMQSGRKYLFCCDINPIKNTTVRIQYGGVATDITSQVMTANVWGRYSSFANMTATNNLNFYYNIANSLTEGDIVQFRNCVLFDLTQMFGAGNEPSTVEEFTSLFSLPYYDYNQGTLLSFMGNGIKTVGFNQWDEEWEVGAYNSADGSKADNVRDRIRNKNPIRIFPSVNYYKNKGLQVYYYDGSMNFIGWNSLANQGIFTPPSNARYMNFNGLAGTGTTYNNDICINISDPERNGTYEPYTSSTLSLPISTYFSNGMASAKNAYNNTIVYDELTPNKATKRLEQYTFTGNETISGITNLGTYYRCYISLSIPSKGVYATRWEKNVPNVYNYTDDSSHYYVQNSQFWYFTTSSTAQAIMNELSGTKFYYDLATPTETLFTTASLVTENAEIPLSNEDGVLIGKCTEQLSSESGFFDAKIKLADEDGECYSNKIQLHIERSPQ